MAALSRQGYEVLSVPIGMKSSLDLGVLSLNEVMNKIGSEDECVIMGVGLDEMVPSLEETEQAFYSLIRKCACKYQSCVIVMEDEDMRIFQSTGYNIDTMGLNTRRELAAKAFMFTSDRDRSLQMSLLTSYGKSVMVIGSGGREHALTHALSKE